jgi:hypothetical protein
LESVVFCLQGIAVWRDTKVSKEYMPSIFRVESKPRKIAAASLLLLVP